jgi:dihydrofolate reductase
MLDGASLVGAPSSPRLVDGGLSKARLGGATAATREGVIVSLTQYYTATTLDGFIADPNNSLDWLFTRRREEDGLLNYGEFIAEIGAMAMGSTTYEWILDHEFAGKDPAEWKWPYEIPCWVFTHRQLQVLPDAPVEFTSVDVAAVHEEMAAAAAGRNIWIVGGGDLAGQFADAGLLDEVIVSIAPVTLGGGAPLLPRRIELRLDELGRNGDFASARFSVVRSPA